MGRAVDEMKIHRDPGIGLAWLLRLRWGAAACVAAGGYLAIQFGGAALPLVPFILLGATTAATNVAILFWHRRKEKQRPTGSTELIGAIVVLDVLILTGVLFSSGGATNPFSALYLVYVTLAAVLLGARWSWSIALLSVVCYAALFVMPGDWHHLDHDGSHEGHELHAPAHSNSKTQRADHPTDRGHEIHRGDQGQDGEDGPTVLAQQADGGYGGHLYGMFIAFALTAALIAYFMAKISGALEEREVQLRAARDAASRSDRLASLTALAAGAAHELGTPLATIAVAAGELARNAEVGGGRGNMAEDARLIRREVDRCRRILDHMTVRAGENVGERAEATTAASLIGEALEGLAETRRQRLRVGGAEITTDGEAAASDAPDPAVSVPRKAFAQALRSLLNNAFEASGEDGQVSIAVEHSATTVRFVIRDDGIGMNAEQRSKAMEPFFTTKAQGLGLGLFLAKNLAERLDGELELWSQQGSGTVATLAVPAFPVAERSGEA